MLSAITNHSQVAARKMLLVQIMFLSQMSLVEADTRLIKKTELMDTGRIVNILSARKDRIWRDL